jgi:glycosyltransferase involved in cell wall biosynthesis
MTQFNLQFPINSTSLGQVATNILYEIFLKKLEPNVFLIGNPDISSFDGILPEDFSKWLQHCCGKSQTEFKSSDPTLKLWHINGSHETVGKNNFLYFFHELDQMTKTEKNILNNFEKVFSPCSFTEKVGEEYGVKNISTIPLGYNSLAFKPVEVEPYKDNPTVIALAGKFEHRKRTAKMIKLLADNWGNNYKFKIHLHVFNSFYDQQNPERCSAINLQLIQEACGGNIPDNFVLMGHFPKLSELNKCYNIADIVVDGSGGESWSLPSFHMAGLGKKAVVHCNSGLKEWANESNSWIVKSSGKISADDGMFFDKRAPFNSGNIYDFEEEEMVNQINNALKSKNKKNDLTNEFSYEKMATKLLENIL